ncbi:putative Serine-type D-Ala-D-Ala carboxypeptidase [Verrucomicrobia bacterium]|nr:putative Serine-type D-Ala-D-Ala carboxypeptidase [Verrucomicrobiota bacterium]
MKIASGTRLVFCAASLAAQVALAAHDHFTDAAEISTFLRDHFEGTNAGMVIGLLDGRGSRLLGAGRLDNHTSRGVDGDTIFEIGSITKTFTALLFLDMVERGEMKLDDPVTRYLPKGVKVPGYRDKEITLLNLAAQDSGLPMNADNLAAGDWLAAYNAYTAADLYAFLSRYALTNAPGTEFRYSNVGMSLLGHVMELKAGTSFESLVVNRICRPLGISSTFITPAVESKARLALGHDEKGRATGYYQLQVMAGAGALLSTANDLLKYLSANLGLRPSNLHPLMDKMQVVLHAAPDEGRTAMPWFDEKVYSPPGTDLLGHAGGTGGCSTFIGFDRVQRRGVVVLSNQRIIHSSSVGWRILQGAPLCGRDAATLQPVREYVAIGFSFELERQTGVARITRVYPESPAAAAGLSPGLIIDRINGVPVAGKSMADSMELMRGPVGTRVELVLITPDGSRSNMVELIKSEIRL